MTTDERTTLLANMAARILATQPYCTAKDAAYSALRILEIIEENR